jgi:hypothetical protein
MSRMGMVTRVADSSLWKRLAYGTIAFAERE